MCETQSVTLSECGCSRTGCFRKTVESKRERL